MIAAYVLGYSIDESYLAENPHLKFAEGADDTGVIISYNTTAPVSGKSATWLPGSIAINPINWRRDGTVALASDNLGSLTVENPLNPSPFCNFVETPGIADAYVDVEMGVVRTSTVVQSMYEMQGDEEIFEPGNYHCYDYGFFYLNLRENAARRAERFLRGAVSRDHREHFTH